MRGWTRTILPLAATAITAGVLAAPGHAQLPPCPPGTTVSNQYCEVPAPVVQVAGIGATCHRNAPVHINAKVSAQAGISRIRITLDGKTIKTTKVASAAATSRTVRLTVPARGLKKGIHTIKIIVTDKSGKHTTKTLTFRVCAPKPKAEFTG
jgi:hypothetical protein